MRRDVIPAKAGIQEGATALDARLRGHDGLARAAALALAFACAGCAATATQNWRTAPDLQSPVWTFKGTQGAWGHTVVNINDQPALEGKVSVWSGQGELAGTYEGKPIAGKCEKGRTSHVRTQCAISVEGRKATTLYFRVK